MRNSDIDVTGRFLPYNASNEEKEEYIEELAAAIRKYVKTGTETKQLENLESLQKIFQKNYAEKQFLNETLKKMQEDTMQKLINDQCVKIEFCKKKDETFENSGFLKKTIKELWNFFVKNIENELLNIVDQVAYYGHINMLYEIYEQEQKVRRKETEYEKLLDEYGNSIKELINIIGSSQRISLKILKQKTDERIQVDHIIIKESQLFNKRKHQGEVKISLSPEGKRFNEYIINASKTYSYQAVKQISKKNCETIIESMAKSYKSGLVYDIKLEKIGEMDARIIQKKYSDTMQWMIDEKRDSYNYARPMKHLDERMEYDEGYTMYELGYSESINR